MITSVIVGSTIARRIVILFPTPLESLRDRPFRSVVPAQGTNRVPTRTVVQLLRKVAPRDEGVNAKGPTRNPLYRFLQKNPRADRAQAEGGTALSGVRPFVEQAHAAGPRRLVPGDADRFSLGRDGQRPLRLDHHRHLVGELFCPRRVDGGLLWAVVQAL